MSAEGDRSAPTSIWRDEPRDDFERGAVVLYILHDGSRRACERDGQFEFARIHSDALTFIDYAVQLHRLNLVGGIDNVSHEKH